MKLFNSKKRILSIDFGSNLIKVVEGQESKDKLNIIKYSSILVPPDLYEDGKIINDVKLINIIKELIKNHKFNKDLQLNVTINSSSIITREVSIPMVADEEIESIIEFQLSEFLPINPDDYVVNHLVIGNSLVEAVEKLKLLLIAIPKGMVLNHLDLMKESDLKPRVLDFQPNSIAKLLNFNNTINGNYNINGKTIVCVDMGYTNTTVSIVKKRNVEVTRTFNNGAKLIYENVSQLFSLNLKEAENKIKEIEDINIKKEEFDDYHRILNITRTSIEDTISNIESVIRYYVTRERDNEIDLIVLYGGLSSINGISEMFSSSLTLETINLKSLDKVDFHGDLAIYANAIGGLLNREAVKR